MERALTALCEALARVPQDDLVALVASCRALLQVDRDVVALALAAPCEQLLDVLLKILHAQVANQPETAWLRLPPTLRTVMTAVHDVLIHVSARVGASPIAHLLSRVIARYPRLAAALLYIDLHRRAPLLSATSTMFGGIPLAAATPADLPWIFARMSPFYAQESVTLAAWYLLQDVMLVMPQHVAALSHVPSLQQLQEFISPPPLVPSSPAWPPRHVIGLYCDTLVTNSSLEGGSFGDGIRLMVELMGPWSALCQVPAERTLCAHLSEKLNAASVMLERLQNFTVPLAIVCRDFHASLSALQQGDITLLPGGWTDPDGGHAMMHAIERLPDHYYRITTINSGEGVSRHARHRDGSLKGRASLWLTSGPVRLAAFTPEVLELWLGLQRHCSGAHDAAVFYDVLLPLLGGVAPEPPFPADDLATPQRSGTCYWRAVKGAVRWMCMHWSARANLQGARDYYKRLAAFARFRVLGQLAQQAPAHSPLTSAAASLLSYAARATSRAVLKLSSPTSVDQTCPLVTQIAELTALGTALPSLPLIRGAVPFAHLTLCLPQELPKAHLSLVQSDLAAVSVLPSLTPPLHVQLQHASTLLTSSEETSRLHGVASLMSLALPHRGPLAASMPTLPALSTPLTLSVPECGVVRAAAELAFRALIATPLAPEHALGLLLMQFKCLRILHRQLCRVVAREYAVCTLPMQPPAPVISALIRRSLCQTPRTLELAAEVLAAEGEGGGAPVLFNESNEMSFPLNVPIDSSASLSLLLSLLRDRAPDRDLRQWLIREYFTPITAHDEEALQLYKMARDACFLCRQALCLSAWSSAVSDPALPAVTIRAPTLFQLSPVIYQQSRLSMRGPGTIFDSPLLASPTALAQAAKSLAVHEADALTSPVMRAKHLAPLEGVPLHHLLQLVRDVSVQHLRAWLLVDLCSKSPSLLHVKAVRVALLHSLFSPFAFAPPPPPQDCLIPLDRVLSESFLRTAIKFEQVPDLAARALDFVAKCTDQFSPLSADSRDAFLFVVRLFVAVGAAVAHADGALQASVATELSKAHVAMELKLATWEAALIARPEQSAPPEVFACLGHLVLLGPGNDARAYVCRVFHTVSAYASLAAPTLEERELALSAMHSHALLWRSLSSDAAEGGARDYMQRRFPSPERLWDHVEVQRAANAPTCLVLDRYALDVAHGDAHYVIDGQLAPLVPRVPFSALPAFREVFGDEVHARRQWAKLKGGRYVNTDSTFSLQELSRAADVTMADVARHMRYGERDATATEEAAITRACDLLYHFKALREEHSGSFFSAMHFPETPGEGGVVSWVAQSSSGPHLWRFFVPSGVLEIFRIVSYLHIPRPYLVFTSNAMWSHVNADFVAVEPSEPTALATLMHAAQRQAPPPSPALLCEFTPPGHTGGPLRYLPRCYLAGFLPDAIVAAHLHFVAEEAPASLVLCIRSADSACGVAQVGQVEPRRFGLLVRGAQRQVIDTHCYTDADHRLIGQLTAISPHSDLAVFAADAQHRLRAVSRALALEFYARDDGGVQLSPTGLMLAPEGSGGPLRARFPRALFLQVPASHELKVLIPNLRLQRASPSSLATEACLACPMKPTGTVALQPPFFLYRIHLSGLFLVPDSVAGAFYIAFLHTLERRYREACDALETAWSDVALPEEANSVIGYFSAFRNDHHPDALACRLRLALVRIAAGDAKMAEEASQTAQVLTEYIERRACVSHVCLLPPREERQLLAFLTRYVDAAPLLDRLAQLDEAGREVRIAALQPLECGALWNLLHSAAYVDPSPHSYPMLAKAAALPRKDNSLASVRTCAPSAVLIDMLRGLLDPMRRARVALMARVLVLQWNRSRTADAALLSLLVHCVENPQLIPADAIPEADLPFDQHCNQARSLLQALIQRVSTVQQRINARLSLPHCPAPFVWQPPAVRGRPATPQTTTPQPHIRISTADLPPYIRSPLGDLASQFLDSAPPRSANPIKLFKDSMSSLLSPPDLGRVMLAELQEECNQDAAQQSAHRTTVPRQSLEALLPALAHCLREALASAGATCARTMAAMAKTERDECDALRRVSVCAGRAEDFTVLAAMRGLLAYEAGRCAPWEAFQFARSAHLVQRVALLAVTFLVSATRYSQLLKALNLLQQTALAAPSDRPLLFERLATHVAAERVYLNADAAGVSFDPRFLVFEMIMEITLRRAQYGRVADMVAQVQHTPVRSPAHIYQLSMGEGKTAVIAPLLALLLTDMRRLVVCALPAALLPSARQLWQRNLSFALWRRICTVEVSRHSPLAHAATVAAQLRAARECNSLVVCTPETLKALLLRYLEGVEMRNNAGNANELSAWLEPLRILRSPHSVLVVDEVDLALNPLASELNFPIRGRKRLELGELRWRLPLELLKAILPEVASMIPAAADVQETLAIGASSGAVMLRPQITLLRRQFYTDTLRRPLAAYAEGLLPRHLHQATTSEQAALQTLMKAWVDSYMPFVLARIHKVHFGLLPNDKGRRFAVPYVAKDCPSESSEFAHPDVALGLTILSYAYEGLTPQALLNLLIGLRELADPASAALWAQWTAHCRWRNAPQLDALVLRADSADLLTAHRHLGRDFGVVCAYLERHVFANLGDAEFKLSSCGTDLLGPHQLIFPIAIGFSGTTDRRLLSSMRYEPDRGATGRLLRFLTSSEVVVGVVHIETDHDDWLRILLRDLQPSPCALIDCGALVRASASEVAATVFASLPGEAVRGVTFYDRDHRLVVQQRGAPCTVSQDVCSLETRECFTYYEHVHTTGSDLALPPSGVAVLTIGKDTTLRDLMQSAMRMRQLGKGQRLILAVPKALEAAVSDFTRHTGGGRNDAAARVAGFALANSVRVSHAQAMQMAVHALKQCYRRVAFEAICTRTEAAQREFGLFVERVGLTIGECAAGGGSLRKHLDELDLLMRKASGITIATRPDLAAFGYDIAAAERAPNLALHMENEAEREAQQHQERASEVQNMTQLPHVAAPFRWPLIAMLGRPQAGSFDALTAHAPQLRDDRLRVTSAWSTGSQEVRFVLCDRLPNRGIYLLLALCEADSVLRLWPWRDAPLCLLDLEFLHTQGDQECARCIATGTWVPVPHTTLATFKLLAGKLTRYPAAQVRAVRELLGATSLDLVRARREHLGLPSSASALAQLRALMTL